MLLPLLSLVIEAGREYNTRGDFFATHALCSLGKQQDMDEHEYMARQRSARSVANFFSEARRDAWILIRVARVFSW